MTPAQLEAELANLLHKGLGSRPQIQNLQRLSGGASRETWSFDAISSDGQVLPLILRRDFEASGAPSLEELSGIGEGLSRQGEYAFMRILAERDLPVPKPVVYPDADSPLQSSFVMERIEGEATPRSILKAPEYTKARGALASQLGDVLGRWRAVPADELSCLPVRPLAMQMQVSRGLLDRSPRERPIFELAYRWLSEHRPDDPARLSIVHGDFRLGNFIVGPNGLRSVIDWEYVHLGDPMEDLAFLCMKPWRFGNVAMEVGGFGVREDLVAGYEQASGDAVDRDVLRFWEVFGQLKWGALCAARAALHIEGAYRSVEVAAIGRRVAEVEYDLLELLE